MNSMFFKGMLALCCVIISLPVLAIPIPGLPINEFACTASGGGTITPDVAEACVVWDIQEVGNGSIRYNYEGEAASTGGVIPTLSALNITGLTLIDRLVIQIDPSLTSSDIFNPSTGFIGVGLLDTVYGVLFENLAEEFSITFETRTLPVFGRFLGLGSTDNGTSFSFDADNVPTPGTQKAGQDVPEPPTVGLLVVGFFWISYIAASRRRRVEWT